MPPIRSAIAALLVCFPVALTAQADRSAFIPTASVGAGLAMAQGMGTAPTLLGSLEFGRGRRPWILRFDGQFTQWNGSQSTTRLTSLTANLAAELRPTGVRPYLVAGGGGYASQGTGVRPGLNAGFGLVVPVRGHELLFESRYHAWWRPDVTGTTAAVRYATPLTLRIRF